MNISILITTYNASNYIIETLESIINQTYIYYEIVIVDDGSTDKTIELINDFIQENKLKNINLILHSHIGRAPALLLGIKNSKYEWVAILDADDIWAKDKLEKQCIRIKQDNISCLFTSCILFNSTNEISKKLKHDTANIKEITLNKILIYESVCHSSVLMKKELATYNKILKKQIDLDLWLQLLSKGHKLYVLESALSFHRIHKNQSFESKNKFTYSINSTKVRYKYALRNNKYCIAAIIWLHPIKYFIKNILLNLNKR